MNGAGHEPSARLSTEPREEAMPFMPPDGRRKRKLCGKRPVRSNASPLPLPNHYKIGRWSDEENNKFVEGLKLFSKWSDVAKYVRTRSETQARSHNQKFSVEKHEQSKNKKREDSAKLMGEERDKALEKMKTAEKDKTPPSKTYVSVKLEKSLLEKIRQTLQPYVPITNFALTEEMLEFYFCEKRNQDNATVPSPALTPPSPSLPVSPPPSTPAHDLSRSHEIIGISEMWRQKLGPENGDYVSESTAQENKPFAPASRVASNTFDSNLVEKTRSQNLFLMGELEYREMFFEFMQTQQSSYREQSTSHIALRFAVISKSKSKQITKVINDYQSLYAQAAALYVLLRRELNMEQRCKTDTVTYCYTRNDAISVDEH